MSNEVARKLRRNQTEAETRLWFQLRRRQLDGHYFRRQMPVGPYVADFACRRARLVIEVDGGQHAERRTKDRKRTEFLRAEGYDVVRFWNNDVLENMEGVIDVIRRCLASSKTPPP